MPFKSFDIRHVFSGFTQNGVPGVVKIVGMYFFHVTSDGILPPGFHIAFDRIMRPPLPKFSILVQLMQSSSGNDARLILDVFDIHLYASQFYFTCDTRRFSGIQRLGSAISFHQGICTHGMNDVLICLESGSIGRGHFAQ